jgi:hypothetical protein
MTFIDRYDFFVFSYIESSISDVKEAIRELLESYGISHGFADQKGNIDLSSIYKPESFDREVGKRTIVIYPSKSSRNSTIFLVNFQDGWHSMVYGISKKLCTKTISIRMSSSNIIYPVNELNIMCSGNTQRIIRVMLDGRKWEFYQKGEPLSIEDTQNYQNRKIKDRFNRNILINYLGKMGFDIQDDTFWEANEAVCFMAKQ